MKTNTPNINQSTSRSTTSRPCAKTTKASKILTLLRRPKGATLAELSKATDWQDHSLRGFLSGIVRKRMGLAVSSEKDAKGIRRYRIEAEGGV